MSMPTFAPTVEVSNTKRSRHYEFTQVENHIQLFGRGKRGRREHVMEDEDNIVPSKKASLPRRSQRMPRPKRNVEGVFWCGYTHANGAIMSTHVL